LAKELRSASFGSNNRDSDAQVDAPMKGATSTSASNSTLQSGMENINIAVIGAAGVGKSTLIQRALGLRSLPTAVASSLKMSVDGVVYTVSMIELDLESFDFNPDSKFVQWPKQINGQIVPRMDGALILYDVMNRDSILDLPQTLSKPLI
jgi:GTPase SAR1 family protein